MDFSDNKLETFDIGFYGIYKFILSKCKKLKSLTLDLKNNDLQFQYT